MATPAMIQDRGLGWVRHVSRSGHRRSSSPERKLGHRSCGPFRVSSHASTLFQSISRAKAATPIKTMTVGRMPAKPVATSSGMLASTASVRGGGWNPPELAAKPKDTQRVTTPSSGRRTAITARKAPADSNVSFARSGHGLTAPVRPEAAARLASFAPRVLLIGQDR